MQPIAEMEDDDFMKLQTLYASELPICTLEDARQVLSWIDFRSSEKGHVRWRASCAGRAAVHRDRCARVEPGRGGAG
jgi:hypothetical protein